MSTLGVKFGKVAVMVCEPYQRTRIARRDLAWGDNDVVWMVYGCPFPDAESVRVGLLAAARSGTAGRFLRYYNLTTGRSRKVSLAEMDDFASRVVVSSDEGMGHVGERAAQIQGEPLDALPFRLTIGPDWVALHFLHVLGDATTVWPLLLSLLEPQRLAGLPAGSGAGEWPLLSAAWSNFVKKPGRLATALREQRPALPVSYGPAGSWMQPEICIESRVSPAGFPKQLAAWRRAHHPGATSAGQLTATAMSAAVAVGLNPFPGVAMVADARRYIPSRRFNAGNFSAGAYITLDDPFDPKAVSEAITRYSQSGRPILTLAAMSVLYRPRKKRSGYLPETQGRSLISISHVGRLPWLMKQGPTNGAVLGQPIGERGIAIVLFELCGSLWASVTYDRRHIDTDVAARIAESLVSLPVDAGGRE